MIISFASKDGLHVDEHFGWCQKFYLYELDANSYCFLHEIDSSKKHEEEVDKLEYKIECIQKSDIVCITQIGPKAATMVQACGIYPMRAKEGVAIEDVLKSLQEQLVDNTPLWLKRIALKDSA